MKNLNELLPIGENNGKRAVNARDLHTFLESKQQFSDWIKGRIKAYDFTEGVDYETLFFDYQGNLLNIRHHNFMKSENQQVSKIEYALSIGMAKELSMVEGNEKGKQARKYFISCEEIAADKRTLSRKDLALMVIQQEEEKERLQLENKTLQQRVEKARPAVLFAESVKVSTSDILIRDLAKLITQNGYVIGEVRLYDWLVSNKYLIRHKRWSKSREKYENIYTPTQYASELGLFRVQERLIPANAGEVPFTKFTSYVTGKGQVYFINKFTKDKFT